MIKKSKKATNYIVIDANTTNECDNSNYALVELVGLEKWVEYDILATEAGIKNIDYYQSEYWSWCMFLNLEKVIDTSGMGWCYVTVTDMENLLQPEDRVSTISMCCKGQGSICWKGYGKYAGGEYSTETIDIKDIINSR